eukprot:12672322-Heterocapsa_arctica.AAC.1
MKDRAKEKLHSIPGHSFGCAGKSVQQPDKEERPSRGRQVDVKRLPCSRKGGWLGTTGKNIVSV